MLNRFAGATLGGDLLAIERRSYSWTRQALIRRRRRLEGGAIPEVDPAGRA